jgi:hypothetical protein
MLHLPFEIGIELNTQTITETRDIPKTTSSHAGVREV